MACRNKIVGKQPATVCWFCVCGGLPDDDDYGFWLVLIISHSLSPGRSQKPWASKLSKTGDDENLKIDVQIER